MNIPTNCREFSLELAQQNHPLVTRAGRPAKFIAYVPENQDYHQVVCSFDGQFLSSAANGRFYSEKKDSDDDLFLAPVGYCQDKPVFAGDELCVKESSLIFKVPVSAKEYDLSLCKWPSKAPIVETRMTETELEKAYWNLQQKHHRVSDGALMVANKAIERAILDGDVVPTIEIVELMCKAFYDNYQQRYNGSFNGSFKDYAEKVLNEYLEGLKK